MMGLHSSVGQRGMALLMVLWILAVMTIMGAAFALSTRRMLDQTRYDQLAAQSLALAEGGVHYAIFMLTHPDQAQKWRSDGTVYALRLPAGDLKIRIQDESGRLDINAMQEPTLRALFRNVLGDDKTAARFADIILDWRDQDNLKRMNGAEIQDYRAAGQLPRPQNRPFLLPEELAGVLDMTPELFARIEPLITVWSGQDGIDPMKASPEMLYLLFQGDEKRVAEIMQARAQAVDGRPPALMIPPQSGFNFVSAMDSAQRVIVEASINGESGMILEVVVRRDAASPGKTFAIASWKTLTGAPGLAPTPRDALGYP